MPLTQEQSNLASSAIGGGASLAGSVISAIVNHRENKLAFERQKELNKQQYLDYLQFAKQNGATPSSIVQGLTHAAGSSVPGVSTGGNPAPDFGQSMSSGVSAMANQRQAEASNVQAYSQREIDLMKLTFEPQKYFADIRKSLSEAFESTQSAFLHGSMKKYYDELVTDLQQQRPWKLASLRQGLINEMARWREINQNIEESKARQGYYNAGSYEFMTRSEYNKSAAYKNYEEGYNASLEGYRKQWEITLLSNGIDPNKPFWENTLRLMTTNPKIFKQRIDMIVNALSILDNKIQEQIGKNYKRNAAFSLGAFYLYQQHQKNGLMRSQKFRNNAAAISSMIPLLGGLSGSPNAIGFDYPGRY